MAKKKKGSMKEKASKKNPKHSLDANRRRNGGKKKEKWRSAATVRRLRMYNTKPKRNWKGKVVVEHEFQSKDLPSTLIRPDRGWFVNTRVISQKELECFREDLQSRMSSSYNVILGKKKLPLSLLSDHHKEKKMTKFVEAA